ncbi:putative membrane protein YqhA [Deinococcus yavapaiensis KR-236]|uniref:Putative membrane protein YqhA n=2 Tax=Deinococcus TaxID=1298 RepID=A0A318SLX4_9DEIO|nr:putative membrane protein YqhA [Deinococcus yavapaiensis KR-236]
MTRPESRPAARNAGTPPTALSHIIGRSRFIVIVAVVAVMLVAVSLFLLGVVQAAQGVWGAWREVLSGNFQATTLTVEFLEIVSTMLKAVVFYIIGVGLYSLFIAPLNLTLSLGVETLSDLESKVVSVVIVILAVTFLEHFIRWEEPLETLQFGGALASVVFALVFFQRYSHKVKEEQQTHNPDAQARAQKELFEKDNEERVIRDDEIKPTRSGPTPD